MPSLPQKASGPRLLPPASPGHSAKCLSQLLSEKSCQPSLASHGCCVGSRDWNSRPVPRAVGGCTLCATVRLASSKDRTWRELGSRVQTGWPWFFTAAEPVTACELTDHLVFKLDGWTMPSGQHPPLGLSSSDDHRGSWFTPTLTGLPSPV